MNRHFSLFLIAVFTITQSVFGQKNYLRYYDLINQAEEQFVVNKNNTECFKLYDKAFAEYVRPFAKDFFIAAEIAYYSGDTIRFLNYIKRSFDAGMTFQCLQQAHLFDSLYTNKTLIAKLNSIYE